MQDDKDIRPHELLIIRNIKRNKENDAVLKRLVGEHYALRKESITKKLIFYCLFDIIEGLDLMPYRFKGKDIKCFFTEGESFEPDFDDIWDAWIYRAKSILRMVSVKDLPRYPEPAYFRNFVKRREENLKTTIH